MKVLTAVFGLSLAVWSLSAEATCSTLTERTVYRPGDKGFVAALALHNDLVRVGDNSRFRTASERPWELLPSEAAFMAIDSNRTLCSERTKVGSCTEVRCNEVIPSLQGYFPGDTITGTSCNPTTFVYTVTTWEKQPNGSWTVISRNQEQRTSCDAM